MTKLSDAVNIPQTNRLVDLVLQIETLKEEKREQAKAYTESIDKLEDEAIQIANELKSGQLQMTIKMVEENP